MRCQTDLGLIFGSWSVRDRDIGPFVGTNVTSTATNFMFLLSSTGDHFTAIRETKCRIALQCSVW